MSSPHTGEEHRTPAAGKKRRNPLPQRPAQVPRQDNSKLSERSAASPPPVAGSSKLEGRRLPAERTPVLDQDDESRPPGLDESSQLSGPTDGSATPEEQRTPVARPAQRRSMENGNPRHEIDGFMPARQSNPPPPRRKVLPRRTGSIGKDDLPPGSMANLPPQSRLRAVNRRAPPSGDSASGYCDGTNCEWRPKSARIQRELAATQNKLMEAERELAATQDELMEAERELAATQDELMEAEAEIRSLKMLGPQSDAA